MKKTIQAGLLLLTILFCSRSTAAQIAIGSKLGVNFGTWIADEEAFGIGSESPPKHMAGINIGLALQIELGEMLSLQQELLYIQKGYRVKYSSGGSTYKEVLKFNYLELPILMKLSFPFNESLGIFANAGPSLGYALDGKYIYIENGDKITEEIDLGEADGLKRTDFSLAFGGGASLRVASVKLLLEARYVYGFSNLFEQNSEGFIVYNRGVGITCGVMVDL